MKKYILFPVLSFVLFAFAACSSDDNGENGGDDVSNATEAVKLTAASDGAPGADASGKNSSTRSVLEGFKVKYVANENIGVFTESNGTLVDKNAKFTNEAATDADGNTDFCGLITENATMKYAYFPYSEEVNTVNDGKINMMLPAEQTAVVGTFDPKANIAVGEVADNMVTFKNVGAVIKFHIQYGWRPGGYDPDDDDREVDPIMSVEFRGNNGEKVAGNITVVAADGSIVGETGDQTSVVLKSQRTYNGLEIHSDYYMVVAPQTFSKGFTMVCHTLANNDIYRVLNKSMTLERNHIYDAGKIVEDANFAAIDLGTVVDGKVVKWADRNVGAYPNDDNTGATLTQPGDFGGYYAFGEIKAKDEYTQANYKYNGADVPNDYSGNPLYDVAAARWGGAWHTPTYNEMIVFHNNCDWSEYLEYGLNGTPGWYVHNKTNKNNCIFIPASGLFAPTLSGVGDCSYLRVDRAAGDGCARNLTLFKYNDPDMDADTSLPCWNGLTVRPAISE